MTQLDQVDSFPLRPRFRFISKYSVEEIEQQLRATLLSQLYPCTGSVRHGFATINISKQDQHFWSPQLTISIEETEEGTSVRGLYGPKPSVWTLFIFFYTLIGFGAIISAMIGFSNLSLDKAAGILWLSPILLLLFLSLFGVSRMGKKLGKEQMQILHLFIETACKQKITH